MVQRRVRMKDVAAHAGVSPRTVSNVVNNYAYVSDEMRARVQASLDELGYQMDYLARGLRSGRTGFIALVVPSLAEPYFAALAESVIRAAREHHLSVLVETTGNAAEIEREVLQGSLTRMVDGVLLNAVAGEEVEDLPAVLLGESPPLANAPHVGIDNVAAARTVVQHLIDCGHRRILAYGNQDTETARLRLEGYRQAMTAARLGRVLSLDYSGGPWSAEGAYRDIAKLLRRRARPPEAIFAFNDSLAHGALRALRERGLAVPGDVAIAGIDDIVMSAFSEPPLTTVAPDLDELAHRAVGLLVDRIGGHRVPHEFTRTLTPFRLIVRASTAG
ncbi:LacI family DNA-binding transcriptional regulator [Kribbella sp.]|uniref:LacI family DNA-binding transcriptional regulator n=1 Tax=Kribbella sp. TaxID=1871183 RepID=UPI002D440966|nr:LacI family DNA-binding transcriptional regulator [Kribbella sp.]HZX02814.1 LacI family DNA-binding transcriptional regulator [Kribbella sp.]